MSIKLDDNQNRIALCRQSGRTIVWLTGSEDARILNDIRQVVRSSTRALAIYVHDARNRMTDIMSGREIPNPDSDGSVSVIGGSGPDLEVDAEAAIKWFGRPPLFEIDPVTGVECRPPKLKRFEESSYDPLKDGPHPESILVFQDAASLFPHDPNNPHVSNPSLCRMVKAARLNLQDSARMVVFISNSPRIPMELEEIAESVRYTLPDAQKLESVVRLMATLEMPYGRKPIPLIRFDTPEQKKHLEIVTGETLGLTMEEARNALAIASRVNAGEILAAPSGMEPRREFHIPTIRAAKTQKIRNSGTLHLFEPPGNLDVVGGMDVFKKECRASLSGFSPLAKADGYSPPKGYLVVGSGGSGKSLLAKALSAEWQMQAVRGDISACRQGLVGASEENLRRMLEMVDRLSPVILWLDEFEKMWAGATSGGGASDGGTAIGMLGYWLTWMQETTSKVFVIATANDVSSMPSVIYRPGRFDQMFYAGLPGPKARKEILDIHLSKRGWLGRTEADPEEIVPSLKRFSGAEIELVVRKAILNRANRRGWGGTDPITMEDFGQAIRSITPIFRTDREEIVRTRNWALSRGVIGVSSEIEDFSYDATEEPPMVPLAGRPVTQAPGELL